MVIIGVIAAITVPTLIHKMRREEVETKLKRVYSVMNQAINMSKIDNGDFDSWDWASLNKTYVSNKVFFDKYIGKYLKVMKIEKMDNAEVMLVCFIDGSVLSIQPNFRDMVFNTQEKASVNRFGFHFSPPPLPPIS